MAKLPHAPTFTPCGAKTRNGGACPNPPVKGSKRCRMHGGKSLKGIAHPNFKTGRWSSSIPERMAERYSVLLDDPAMLDITHEIALTDTRISELLQRVGTGESKGLWQQARKSNDDIQKAIHNENYGAVLIATAQLDRLIGEGLTDYEAWSEIHTLIDQRRKLAESERKRRIEAEQMLTIDQAMSFTTAVLNLIRSSVDDPATRMKIQSGINDLLHKSEAVSA